MSGPEEPWLRSLEPGPWAIGLRLLHWWDRRLEPGYRIAGEDVVLGRNARTSVVLARFGGMLAAPMCVQASGVAWHDPGTWLKGVTGRAPRKREARKARSLEEIPRLVPSLEPYLKALGRVDHLTDACGVGLYEIRRDRGDEEGADR